MFFFHLVAKKSVSYRYIITLYCVSYMKNTFCNMVFSVEVPIFIIYNFLYSVLSIILGITRNLTDLFTSARGLRTSESTIESNKLFIRLSKIVADEKLAASSPSSRRGT